MPIVSGGGGGTFNGGTITEGLVIADPDPAETQLLISLPAGTSLAGATVLIVDGEGAGNPLQLDAYGVLTLRADTVDPTNGGGQLVLRNSTNNLAHSLVGDNGAGAPQAGFFGTSPVVKPTVAGAKLPADVVMASLLTALVALGLVTDTTT